jgi:hypothetical protein
MPRGLKHYRGCPLFSLKESTSQVKTVHFSAFYHNVQFGVLTELAISDIMR